MYKGHYIESHYTGLNPNVFIVFVGKPRVTPKWFYSLLLPLSVSSLNNENDQFTDDLVLFQSYSCWFLSTLSLLYYIPLMFVRYQNSVNNMRF